MEKQIVIIDGNSLINRAYYAMQRPMITKGGLYTQGVYGFLNMLTKIKKDYEPEYMVIAFDRKAPTFRHKAYDDYKAGRKKMPDELAMQLPILKDVLSAMNISMLETDGFEADDIIGTVALASEKAGLYPLIITGDKDELQLASDITRVLITRKGISEFEIFDRQAMIDKYGFTPKQFIDFKGLMGDPSDNYPGIPGVGEKTATKLLLEYGSVENLIANSDSIKNEKMRLKVQENAQLAMMSKRLATICTEVPIDFETEDFRLREPDYDKLIDIYVKLEFNTFLKKLGKSGKPAESGEKKSAASHEKNDNYKDETKKDDLPAYGTENPSLQDEDEENFPKADFDFELLSDDSEIGISKLTRENLREFENALEGNVYLKTFSDGNHRAYPQISGMAFLPEKAGTLYFAGADSEIQYEAAAVLAKKKPRLLGHDLKNDFFVIMNILGKSANSGNGGNSASDAAGNPFAEYVTKEKPYIFETYFDTAIAEYVIASSGNNYDLDILIREYFHEDFPEEKKFLEENAQFDLFSDSSEKLAEYALKWCRGVSSLASAQKNKINSEGLAKVYCEAELPLVEVMASMEYEGFMVDREELTSSASVISSGIEKLTAEIYSLAGEEFNINSPVQLGNILFEKLGLPAGKKTKKGYSTSAEVLEKLRGTHRIADLILEYRTISKLKSTYIDGMLPLIADDGKVHAHFRQMVTATGRISCTEPNLQNIPVRQELGRKLRKAFVPSKQGAVLTGADYSQIELRVLAHMSADEALISAFGSGDDIHAATASRVFGVPLNEVTPLMRSNAKAVNFGVIYGMSSFGLAEEIHVSRKEADRYIKEYFARHTAVKAFMDRQIEYCRKTGCVKTLLNRKRHIHEINASNYMVRQLGERLAMNSPIQGSAADIIKLAMIRVYRKLNEAGMKSKLILQVHDELIIETLPEEKEAVAALLRDEMMNAMELLVSLEVSCGVGSSWYELK
ncbi:MAG: DNA polymerase I [Clostridia bacterium]|nr:DNA polymerase I [Clostridia bacterium]